ncbi:MAG TPA: amino acid racemase [Candidatus Nanoarchaeia archaeon]|nr:amino acid racemase [Candidatus Nanoarchaeia archaeon]
MQGLKIGVLGGIGPEATGYFYTQFIKRLQDKRIINSNADFPQIIINSIPAPELIFDRITENDLEPYLIGLKDLEKHSPEIIVMVCNTIHLYYDFLTERTNTTIIDLRKIVERHLKKNNIKRVTVVATSSSLSLGLYHFPEITYHNPSPEEQKEFSQLIFKFNQGIDKEEQIQRVKKIVQEHLKEESQAVLLGCTEFAVMLNDLDIPKINTIDLLIDYLIDYILESRNKKRFTAT